MKVKVDRKMILRCFAACLLFLVPAYLGVRNAAYKGGMVNFYLDVFGGTQNYAPESILIELLTKGIPLIFFLYIFATCFRQDFLISSVYVFVRMDSREKWLRQRAVSLGMQVFIAWGIAFLLVYLYGLFYGIELNATVGFILLLFLTNFLSCLALVFLQNCLSIRLGSVLSFFIVLAFYAVSLLLGAMTKDITFCRQFVFYLFPPVNGMYLWHESLYPQLLEERFHELIVPGFNVFVSFLSCLVWLWAIYGVTAHTLKRSDLLDIGKER